MKKILLGLLTIGSIFTVVNAEEEKSDTSVKTYFSYGMDSYLRITPNVGARLNYGSFSLDNNVGTSINFTSYEINCSISMLYNIIKKDNNNYYIGLKGEIGKIALQGEKISKGTLKTKPCLVIGKERKNKFIQVEISPFTKFEHMQLKTTPSGCISFGHYF